MILKINLQELINNPVIMISPLIGLAILFILLAIFKGRKKLTSFFVIKCNSNYNLTKINSN